MVPRSLGAAILLCFAAAILTWAAPRAFNGDYAASGPCGSAIKRHSLGQAANDEAIRLLGARKLEGAVMVQSVDSGATLVLAGTPSAPGRGLSPAIAKAPLLPLSTVKLMTAASWLDHQESSTQQAPDIAGDRIGKMLVDGQDEPGRQVALLLRRTVGSEVVLADLARFGFPPCAKAEPPPPPSSRACVELSAQTSDADWASALSIGEANITVSLTQLSAFLRAIGNGWRLVLSVAPTRQRRPGQILSGATATDLQILMMQAAETGTAKGIRGRLGDKWKLGGKTGTGAVKEQPYDGIFAGLLFSESDAEYTVICYVRRGGPGGGAAAEICADVMKFILGI